MIGVYRIFIGIITAAVLCLPGGAFAAADGCDKEDNDRIAPGLALCTTHAFNVGLDRNPTDEAQRQLMRDVIALKTTVMTQQMYKQYEYLDATIKRMKTQLEKAILTTKMQAAGASTSDGSSGSSSSKSSNRNIVLSGAYDCMAETGGRTAVFDCLSRNLSKIRDAASGGNYGDAARQLKNDYKAFDSWAPDDKDNKDYKKRVEESCKDVESSRAGVEGCINQMSVGIVTAREVFDRANRIIKPQQ